MLEYPLTEYVAACELTVERDTCCDSEVTAVAVTVGAAGTELPPLPPPPPQDASTMLAVVRDAKKYESERRIRITPYYRLASRSP
jgi:hypothetical protein